MARARAELDDDFNPLAAIRLFAGNPPAGPLFDCLFFAHLKLLVSLVVGAKSVSVLLQLIIIIAKETARQAAKVVRMSFVICH
jgi:hypothetical protein